MEILMINVNKFEYKNKDSANKLIRYITRTRPDEDRANELLSYGFTYGNGYMKPIDHVIKEFEYIHNYYSAEGCLMCHYVMQISDRIFTRMNNDLKLLDAYAQECCRYIMEMGHQVCYAIHYSKEDRLHIHFAINAINFMTGHKLRQYPAELKKTIEYPLNDLIYKYFPDRYASSLDDLAS